MSLLDKAIINPVLSEDINHYVDVACKFISLALSNTDGETELTDIIKDIKNNDRQLWVVKRDNDYIAAIVTMIYTTQSGLKVGEITLAGGSEHDSWDHFPDGVGEWFKLHGCKYIDIIGRKGWERLYSKRGFRNAYIQLRKEL